MKDSTELEIINNQIFQPCNFEMTAVEEEPESNEYSGHQFRISGRNVKFRKAKITPTKTGQFVTLWKRNQEGVTEPFNITDDFDFYIIVTRNEDHMGAFIFSKIVLHQQGILSDKTKEGKRGFRVYPPWDLTTNKQAEKSQQWQIKYFVDLSKGKLLDLEHVKGLLNAIT